MTNEEAFNQFLTRFIPVFKEKAISLNKASWQLETTGSKEAAVNRAQLSNDLKMLLNNKTQYEQLALMKKEGCITSPQLLRMLNLLIKEHKANIIPVDILEKISIKESEIAQAYVNFRPTFEGKTCTENDLNEILKEENDPKRREEAWNASKQIGEHLADDIMELVKYRNQMARRTGYSDFYEMQLDLNEVDKEWLFSYLEKFAEESNEAYDTVITDIKNTLGEKYKVQPSAIGPWAWGEPFCQEDPLGQSSFDSIVKELDLIRAATSFYDSLGFDVHSILERSDLFEREKKNQHAFCINIDHKEDIRILTNLRPTVKWLETILHELGHAIYEQGYDENLPWMLRTPPHMITTEAIALITGRQAYDPSFLKEISNDKDIESKLSEALRSQKRRQLLFSRWVLVMVYFESSLYANPEQDLNSLWWTLVQKYQKICPPSKRSEKKDWACKYHIGLAPVYYHSYLLGEFFASMLKEYFVEMNQSPSMYGHRNIGNFLKEELFYPGNRMKWDNLIKQIMGKPLEFHAWIKEFGK